jgi:cadmium resistance protein CadD (predicted permease)
VGRTLCAKHGRRPGAGRAQGNNPSRCDSRDDNIDDRLLLALYFGRAQQDRTVERRIVLGQYLGFCAILAISVIGAFGVGRLPESAIAYLGLILIALGIRAAIEVFRHRKDDTPAAPADTSAPRVAAITFSNGGDNIGVYIPVFATVGAAMTAAYAVSFLAMVALWCVAGRYIATRPVIARPIARWGHIMLPIVLITIGTLILVHGGAFGL